MFFSVYLVQFWCGLCVLLGFFCFVHWFVYLWEIFGGFLGCVVCLVAGFFWFVFFLRQTQISNILQRLSVGSW